MLLYNYSPDFHSASLVVVGMLDSVVLFTTIAGTLLAMLQNRHRPVWPAFAAPRYKNLVTVLTINELHL